MSIRLSGIKDFVDPDYGKITLHYASYTRAVKSLIDEYLDLHPGGDRARLYVGGTLGVAGYPPSVAISTRGWPP